MVSDACFLSGLIKIDTQLDGRNQDSWRPKFVYHYIQWKNITPDFVLDISGFMDKKTAAILAYGSQFHNPNSKEPETPISSKTFIESVKYRAQDMGRLVGKDYAEGFTVERLIAVDRLDSIV
jgi:LmbE family N-acetylglucosaminyl deacetylase